MLIDDEWLRLRADSCRTASGTSVDPFYVFEYRPWVTIVPITTANEVVLVRQYRHGLGEITLELPGGTLDQHETDVLKAARRELKEETGFTGPDFRELAAFSPNPSSQNNLSHAVLATRLNLTDPQNLDPSEDIEVELVPLDEVRSVMRRREFMQAMHIAALFFALEHLQPC